MDFGSSLKPNDLCFSLLRLYNGRVGRDSTVARCFSPTLCLGNLL